MMKKIIVLLVALVLVFTLSACSSDYTNISNDELREMLDDYSNYHFIDVRTSEEFYEKKITGFNINIDYLILEDDYSLLDNIEKSIPVVIACKTGERSVDASSIFVDEGFEVYILKNGIDGWDGETTP